MREGRKEMRRKEGMRQGNERRKEMREGRKE